MSTPKNGLVPHLFQVSSLLRERTLRRSAIEDLGLFEPASARRRQAASSIRRVRAKRLAGRARRRVGPQARG